MDVPSIEMVKEILDTNDQNIHQQKPVYIHCYARLGRTGIVSGCWLAIHNKLEGNKVLKLLSKIRREQNHLIHWDGLQTMEQSEVVLNWKYGE